MRQISHREYHVYPTQIVSVILSSHIFPFYRNKTVSKTADTPVRKVSLPLPGGSDGKASAYNAGDPDSIPGSGRSLGEGNGKPLQYSCLENPMDRGAWRATVHVIAKSWT